jgi:hypothetical protein
MLINLKNHIVRHIVTIKRYLGRKIHHFFLLIYFLFIILFSYSLVHVAINQSFELGVVVMTLVLGLFMDNRRK